MGGHDRAVGTQGLNRVIVCSIAVSLGVMSAFLYSIKEVNPVLQLDFTLGTAGVFIVAAAAGGIFARLMLLDASASGTPAVRQKKGRHVSMVILAAGLNLGMFASFAFALRGIANDKLVEVIQGTALALLALSGIGFLFWRVARFLEKDSKRTLNANHGRDSKDE